MKRENRGVAGTAGGPAVDVMGVLDRLVRRGEVGPLAALPTGLQPLDRVLDGGMRPGELVLVGGAQGVGKTTFVLQIARNLAAQAQATAAFVCYEHEELSLLQRIIAQEAYLACERPHGEAPSLSELRGLILSSGQANGAAPARELGLADLLGGQPAGIAAYERIRSYGERLYLFKALGTETDVAALRRIIRDLKERHGARVALFVDYLQKVPVVPDIADESERVTRVVNDLKDLTLSESVPIVAVVAADRAGLEAQRLRIHHLRGSSSLSYESDVVLILNNKYRIVAKRSIAYNYHQAQGFKDWVVCTVEKNRAGRDQIDLEFRAHFAHSAFDPAGDVVADALINERLQDE